MKIQLLPADPPPSSMPPPHELEVVVEARTRREGERSAADMLARVLAQGLIRVEDWCGTYSEYFLG